VNVSIPITKDFSKVCQFALDNKVELVIPGPEQPLVDGISAAFQKVGISVFGPSAKAAQLEGSKAFSKDFMKKHQIPTAEYQVFTDFEKAKAHILSLKHKYVIKVHFYLFRLLD
jgi:phosphoribosylamine--glycine ligase/phosphoribosylformylglycinamidine cyclo-ligase